MENIEAMLCAYIEGDLDEAGRAEIEKHLAANPQHRKMIADLIAQRQLLRDLPRVSAPGEVDETLRGRMERSILLETAGETAAPGVRRGWRWPQMMTIAAILLLSAALGLIVYRTVVPTFKPAAYTQIAANKQPNEPVGGELETDIKTARDQTNPAQTQESSEQPALAEAQPNPAQTQPAEIAMAMPKDEIQTKQNIVLEPTTAPAAQLDDQSRQQLTSNGYQIPADLNQPNAPVVVVIGSDEPGKTNRQVARFLNTQTEISWGLVPARPGNPDIQLREMSAIQSGSGQAMGRTLIPTLQPATQMAATQPSAGEMGLLTTPARQMIAAAPSTQPTRDIYVVRGETPLAKQQIQAILSQGQANPILMMPDEPANLPATMAIEGAATQPATMPSSQVGGSPMPSTAPALAAAPFPPGAGPVDVIIVVQPNPPVPATLPSLPTTQPALPTTEPSTHPSGY